MYKFNLNLSSSRNCGNIIPALNVPECNLGYECCLIYVAVIDPSVSKIKHIKVKKLLFIKQGCLYSYQKLC